MHCPRASCSARQVSSTVQARDSDGALAAIRTYVDLIIGPPVHTQGLDLGYVGAQLAVDRGASHAQENAQLHVMFILVWFRLQRARGKCRSRCRRQGAVVEGGGGPEEEGYIHSMMPSLEMVEEASQFHHYSVDSGFGC